MINQFAEQQRWGGADPHWTRRPGDGWNWLLPAIIVGLIALVGMASIVDIQFDRIDTSHAEAFRSDITDANALRASLIYSESGVRGYVLTGRPEYLESFGGGKRAINAIKRRILPKLDNAADPANPAETRRTASAALTALYTTWETAIGLVADNRRDLATQALLSPDAAAAMDQLRSVIADFLEERANDAARWDRWAEQVRVVIHVIDLGGVFIAITAMIYGFRRITRAIAAGFDTRAQIERLFKLTDMLQSAADRDDTNEVLRAATAELLPGTSGALYVFNNSRDRLDLSMEWGSAAETCADHFAPNSCWALKRGKPHINRVSAAALRCPHTAAGQTTLEIPMAARGEVYGLLEIMSKGADSAKRLETLQPIASAIADAMSLALSSLTLRERLRNQALRDPLTGLFNRRFLEEMLDRMCTEAERRQAPLAAIMVDLDHFKKLNDQYGHAVGDAVLRDVAAAVLSCLRSTDIACRYGGEELAILLPDCSVAQAAERAEQVRDCISKLREIPGVSVTASLGVAAIPESATRRVDLLPNADAALYQAKQHGRNRVVLAPARDLTPRLSVIEGEQVDTLFRGNRAPPQGLEPASSGKPARAPTGQVAGLGL